MGVRALPLNAVVLAEIVVRTVVVAVTVCLVVFVAVADQVVESEAVVAGDKVDARLGSFARLGVDVGAAADAAGSRADHPIIAAPETADIIPVPAIPLCPATL